MQGLARNIFNPSAASIEANCDKNLKFFNNVVTFGLNNLPTKIAQRDRIRDYGNLMYNRGLVDGRVKNYHPGADTGVLRGDWTTTTRSATSIIREDFKTICARAEHAYRTDAIARRVVNILAYFIVGQGNRPYPAVKKYNGEMVEGINSQLSMDWERFNDQGIRTGPVNLTIYQAQLLKFITMVVYGSFLQNIIKSKPGSLLPFAFQLLKPTRLDFSKDTYLSSGYAEESKIDNVIHGIKFNAYGEPEKYYFDGESKARLAENIDLVFFPIEIEQYLGLSWLTPILPAIYDRQQLISDKLKTSRIGAKLGYRLPPESQEGIENLLSTDNSGNSYFDLDYQGFAYFNGKAEPLQITDPLKDTLVPLIKMVLEEIAVGAGFSYQRLTSDLQDANFSGARTNTIADKKIFNVLYSHFVKSSNQLDWNRFVEWEAFTGRLLKYGVGYSNYLADPWYYNQCYWLPKDGEDWIDPLNDAQALILLYKSGQITYAELCSKARANWRAKIKQIVEEREEMKAMGLEHMLPENISATAKVTDTSEDDNKKETKKKTTNRRKNAEKNI